MECSVDDVHLLFAREPHEVHGVAGHSNRQAGILLRMLHRIEQHVPVQHVHVHVIAGAGKERVQHRGQIDDAIFGNTPETGRHERRRERDAIGRVPVRDLRNRRR